MIVSKTSANIKNKPPNVNRNFGASVLPQLLVEDVAQTSCLQAGCLCHSIGHSGTTRRSVIRIQNDAAQSSFRPALIAQLHNFGKLALHAREGIEHFALR